MIPKWQWRIFKRALNPKNRYKPFSRAFGHDRGRPIDRFYIDGFIAAEAGAIRGRVLEIGDNNYTRALGSDRVTRSDILSPVEDPNATVIADLMDAPQIPDESFDCIILTQVLQYIYDHQAAIRTLHRILKPGGTVLATVPFLSALSGADRAKWGEYWRFSSDAARRMFGDVFGPANVEVHSYGNLALAMA